MNSRIEEQPLYDSEPHARSLWQRYRVYADRVELDLHVPGVWAISLDEIRSVELRPPLVLGDAVRGEYTLDELARTLKVDLADLCPHVALLKRGGVWRQIRLTPSDPSAFIDAVERARDGLVELPEGLE